MSGKKKLGMLSAAVMAALVLGSGVSFAADTESQESMGEEAVYRSNLEMTDEQIDALFDDVNEAYGNGDVVLLADNNESSNETVQDNASNEEEKDNEKEEEFDSKTDTTAGAVTPGNKGYVTGGQVYESLNDRVNSLDGKINRVGAGAAALAALHPETFNPGDKWSFAVGYGHYENANAGAIGAFFKPNADTTVSLGSTIGNGPSMVNAGVSFKLGSRGVMPVTGGVDQKDFLALKAENEAQTKEIQAQRKDLDEQRQALNVLRQQMLQLLQGLRKH